MPRNPEKSNLEPERLEELKEAEMGEVNPYPEDIAEAKREKEKQLERETDKLREEELNEAETGTVKPYAEDVFSKEEIEKQKEILNKEYSEKKEKEAIKEQAVRGELNKTESEFQARIGEKNEGRKEANKKELSKSDIDSLGVRFYLDKLGYKLEFSKGIRGFLGLKLELSDRNGKRIMDPETNKAKVIDAGMAGVKDREGLINFLKGKYENEVKNKIETKPGKESQAPEEKPEENKEGVKEEISDERRERDERREKIKELVKKYGKPNKLIKRISKLEGLAVKTKPEEEEISILESLKNMTEKKTEEELKQARSFSRLDLEVLNVLTEKRKKEKE